MRTELEHIPSAQEVLERPDIALVCSQIEKKLRYARRNPVRVLNMFEPDAIWDIARKFGDNVTVDSVLESDNYELQPNCFDIIHIGKILEQRRVAYQGEVVIEALDALKRNGKIVMGECKPAVRHMISRRNKGTNIHSPWTHVGPVVINKR